MGAIKRYNTQCLEAIDVLIIAQNSNHHGSERKHMPEQAKTGFPSNSGIFSSSNFE